MLGLPRGQRLSDLSFLGNSIQKTNIILKCLAGDLSPEYSESVVHDCTCLSVCLSLELY